MKFKLRKVFLWAVQPIWYVNLIHSVVVAWLGYGTYCSWMENQYIGMVTYSFCAGMWLSSWAYNGVIRIYLSRQDIDMDAAKRLLNRNQELHSQLMEYKLKGL